MDALILSCATGGGHNAAAAAVEQALRARGHRVRRLDPLSLSGEAAARRVGGAYVGLVQRAPSAFGAVYGLGDMWRHLPGLSPVYFALRPAAARLGAYLQQQPCDAIVMTHLFPAEMVTALRRRGQALPYTCFVATDYACTPFTEETACDAYVLPAEDLRADFVRRGLPSQQLHALGIPVAPSFAMPADRAALKRRLGLEESRQYILLSGGSVGSGGLEGTTRRLLAHYEGRRVGLVVICGENRRLYARLQSALGTRCVVLGHTPRMADYLRACEVFITKPGGLSSTEAAVAGAALIHLRPIPGCETLNMRYFASHGMCVAVSAPDERLLRACDSLLEGGRYGAMRENQRRALPQNAAENICRLLEEGCARRAVFPGAGAPAGGFGAAL